MAVKASTSITLSAVVDVASCTRYYLLQSSTLSPPAKPTTKPPTGSWNDTEPTYTSGSTNSLYFCDLTVFSDGTWSYSSVSRSSSYEAAKEAYNRALAAQESAEAAQTDIDHLDIGGRNLVLGTGRVFTDFSYVYLDLSPVISADPKAFLLAIADSGLTLSFDISAPDGVVYNSGSSSSLHRVGIYFSFSIRNGEGTQTLNTWYGHHSGPNEATLRNNSSWTNSLHTVPATATAQAPDMTPNGHFSYTVWPKKNTNTYLRDFFVHPENYAVICNAKLYIEKSGITGDVTISNIKLERGSRETDWTAAPEDTDAAIREAQETAAKALSNTEIIVGTQTAATGSWTGVASFSSLADGQQIVYWLPYAGSGNASLNLTLAGGGTTGAIPCYYSGSSRITTHYAAGNAIHLTYRVNANVSGTNYTGWWADANYNTDSNNVDRLQYGAALAAAEAIAAGKLAAVNAAGKLIGLSTTAFDVTKPILYVSTAYTSANVNSATTRATNYYAWGTAFSLATTVSGFSGTAGSAVYIKGTLNGNMFTPAAGVLTTTTPTTDDGYTYMLLGLMSTTVNAVLAPEHPMFRYQNGAFKAISQISYEAFLAAEDAQETADTNTQSIQRLNQNVSGLSTQFNVFSSGIEATIEDHSEILSAMSFSTEGLKVQMAGSIYYTLTDDVGYHIYQNDKEIASFSEGKGKMDELQMGNIICRKTSKGGWVWTEVNS